MTDLIRRPTFTCLTCGTVHYSSDAYIACRDSHPPPSLVDRLRFGSIDDDLLDAAKEAADDLERLHRALHDIAEEWAGAECGEPVTAQEAYAIGLARRMYSLAADALRNMKRAAP